MLWQYKVESIKKRRALLNPPLTQQELAKAAGISQSVLSKIESRAISPSYATVEKIFDVLERLEHKTEKKAEDVMHSPVILFNENSKVEEVSRIAKKKAISQFPVLRKGIVAGSISTNALVGADKSDKLVKFIQPELPTFEPQTPISIIIPALKYSNAVLVTKEGKIMGIITPEDVI